MDGVIRRRVMVESKENGAKLMEHGEVTFNGCYVTISDANAFRCRGVSPMNADAYEVKRYVNITDFTANETTGTGNTADISNKHSGFVIPAGATCVFKATGNTGHTSSSYQYVAVQLRDTGTGYIKRIGGGGNNLPSMSATWTQESEIEIGCIALEYSHWRRSGTSDGGNNNTAIFTLSLTVNGEEWLL